MKTKSPSDAPIMERWERTRISPTNCLHSIKVGGNQVLLAEMLFDKRRVILPPQSVELIRHGSESCRIPDIENGTWKWERYLQKQWRRYPMLPHESVAFLTVLMLGEYSSIDRSCVTDMRELHKLLKKRKSHGKKR